MTTTSHTHAQDVPLLTTKLCIPPVRPGLVSRPRLVERLNQGLDRKLTLVSAPAGFGKTTLLSEWTAECKPRPRVAWVSLDENDNDPVRFWSYVFTALHRALPAAGQTAMAMLHSTPVPAIETILTALINEIAAGATPLTLILDDYQTIKNHDVHVALGFLLDHLPPLPDGLQLVIATRLDPPLNIARLRVRGQLTELRAGDLRFTFEKAGAFLSQATGVELAPQDVAALKARTEGWVAGLQVAAMAMQNCDDVSAFIAAFTGSHRYILSYLVQEVLERQPEHVRSFLYKTAVLERLNGALCDALTGQDNGQEMLERLERANLFIVPLDDEGRWYRYHHLFNDVLRARLKREYGSQEVLALHRRASDWYDANGFVSQGIQHALEAQEPERAAGLIEQHAQKMLDRSELNSLLGWIRALPADLVAARPALSMIYGWALLATGHSDEAEGCMRNIERAVGATTAALTTDSAARASLAPETIGALIEVLVLRLSQPMARFDTALVLGLVGQVLPYLDDDTTFPRLFNPRAALRPVVIFNMALAYEFSGQIAAATQAFAEASALARETANHFIVLIATSRLARLQVVQGRLREAHKVCQDALRWGDEVAGASSPIIGVAHVELGNLLYEHNDLEAALAHLQKGIALLKPWRYSDGLLPGYIGLARAKRAQGDWDSAFAAVDELTRFCSHPETQFVLPIVNAFRASLCVAGGNLAAAAEWAAASGLSADGELSYLQEDLYLVLARVSLAQGNLAEATQLLARLLLAAEQGQRTGRLIEVLTLQALTYQAQGQQAQALTTLQQALTLAEPEGYVRTFADEGQSVAALLNAINGRPATVDPRYVQKLLAACLDAPAPPPGEPSPAVQPAALIEALSERELELLRLIAAGMTNRAIADELIVSVNTVKTHARNIYGKLGVRNRTEATTRARDLGLI